MVSRADRPRVLRRRVLFAAAASLIFRTLDWLAATLLGVMFVIFVTTMHVPGAIKTGEHYAWIVALRDLSFGGGAMAYAGALGVGRLRDGSSWLGTLGRLIVGRRAWCLACCTACSRRTRPVCRCRR